MSPDLFAFTATSAVVLGTLWTLMVVAVRNAR